MQEYFTTLFSYIPAEVSVAVLIIVFATEATKGLISILENYLEVKKGKEILIFNHTKIIFVIIWSLIASVILAGAKVYSWNMMPLYCIGMYGAASIFYELILKKINSFLDK